jgi:antibiotic biosynthesis monooxygenase (ABM) superfamily enzyme
VRASDSAWSAILLNIIMAIHIAITRRVRPGCEAEFQGALRDFFQTSFGQSGVLGASMLSPPPGSGSREFGILRTFADEKERDAFYESPMFKAWDKRARMMTEGEPVYRQLHGLEAWFRSPVGPPPRWKMGLTTLLGVFPTSLFLAVTVGKAVHTWPLAARSLAIATAMVALLTWIVMPLLTRLLHGWLHSEPQSKKTSYAQQT